MEPKYKIEPRYKIGTFELEEELAPIVVKVRHCRDCGKKLPQTRYWKCVACQPTLPSEYIREAEIHS